GSRFNGAAIFRSRKCAGPITGVFENAALQWGRDLSIAEIIPSHYGAQPCQRLQWGRDLSIAEIYLSAVGTGLSITCFNGAAIFRSRKFFPDGPANNLASSLQWGRDLSIAEMGCKWN